MAVSPLRTTILRGVSAMKSGVQNPYGQPYSLGPAKITPDRMPKKRSVGDTGRPVSSTPQNQGMSPSQNKLASTNGGQAAKSYDLQSTAAGDKKYGLSGRSAPNVGPVSDTSGYKKRTMVQAAKAAVENQRQKKLQIGGI